jgi:hypothetical protein
MSDHDYPYKAKARIEALIGTLRTASGRDPNQEMRGIAIPVLFAAIDDIKAALRDDPVVQAVASALSPEALGSGESIRAIDALLVAQQLDAAIGPYPVVIA